MRRLGRRATATIIICIIAIITIIIIMIIICIIIIIIIIKFPFNKGVSRLLAYRRAEQRIPGCDIHNKAGYNGM